jgi:hypothetical protein
VRTALQDAASVAGLLVTTEAMVAEKPERKARRCLLMAAAWVALAMWTPNPAIQREQKGQGARSAFFRVDHGRSGVSSPLPRWLFN